MEGSDCGPISSTITLCLEGLSKIKNISDTTLDIRNMNWGNPNMTQGRQLLDWTFRSATSNAYILTVCYHIECSELPPCLSPLFRKIISHTLHKTSHDTRHKLATMAITTNPTIKTGVHKSQGTILRTVTPCIYGSSAYKVLPITYLEPKILTWLQDFWKNCVAMN